MNVFLSRPHLECGALRHSGDLAVVAYPTGHAEAWHTPEDWKCDEPCKEFFTIHWAHPVLFLEIDRVPASRSFPC